MFLHLPEVVPNELATRSNLLDGLTPWTQSSYSVPDTLSRAERPAILRLDGDLYESTIQALDGLYHKLSVGGFLIIDDYGNVAGCRQAVHDFRAEHGITDAIEPIDWGGVYWRQSADRS